MAWFSQKKTRIGEKVKFAGHIISRDGVSPDPKRTMAISNFPSPKNLTQLWSYLGLVNQLDNFNPDLAVLTAPLRPLLHKDVPFLWLPEHEIASQKVRSTLISTCVNQHFDTKCPKELTTDASCHNGIGHALFQCNGHADRPKIIKCGSRSLSETESRYATVELECLAIQWAVFKCNHYLQGMPNFTVFRDHKPLVGLFSKNLEDIANTRLKWFREKLMPYTFDIQWIKGKNSSLLMLSVELQYLLPHQRTIITVRESPTQNHCRTSTFSKCSSIRWWL